MLKQLIGLAVLLVAATASAQTPQTLPRVQDGDVKYLGSFDAPSGVGLPAGPNALLVKDDLVYFGCARGWAVLTLPAIGGTAALVSPCNTTPNLSQIHRTGYPEILPGGLIWWNGRFISTAWAYYDGGGGAYKSHYAGATVGTLSGPYTMAVPALEKFTKTDDAFEPKAWDRASMVAGYMGIVPAEWRTLMGAVAMTGQCCIPIIGRSSFGPSVSFFNPDHVGVVDPVPSWMGPGYPIEHQGLGAWDASPPSPFYGGTDQLGSVAFPSGTRSILLTGRHGDTWCYGPGTADPNLVGTVYGGDPLPRCFDPTDLNRGNHGPPYRPTMWAYDANDVLAVKSGAKKPWEIQPYAKWTLPGMPIDGATNLLRAGTYDDATRRLYVASTDALTVHVFAIGLGDVDDPPPPPTTATITLNETLTYQTMRGWEVTAQMNQFTPEFPQYRDAVLDKVVEAGINRVRLEVRSGSENPVDSFANWKAAGFPSSGAAYTTWRAKRYETINDNASASAIALAGYKWSELDDTIDRIVTPLRARLAAKGEALYVNLTLVSFYGQVTSGASNLLQQPAEYAEFMLAAFEHLKAKYGWVPNGINLVLEPDNTVNWGGALLGQVTAATGARLAAAGFTPDIISPSTTNMTTAPTWFDQMLAVPNAAKYLKELSYHRYSGVTSTALAAIASKAQAAGISTAMLEWWDPANTVTTLHEDLTVGRVSAWQQATMVDTASPAGLAIAHVNLATPTVAMFTAPTLAFKQYYQGVRAGAVRLEATSTLGTLAPLAFRNVDGRYTVVVKATAGGPVTIAGLPAGAYVVTSTAGSHADQTLTAGGVLTTSLPAAGVLTVIGKGGAPPPPDKDCDFTAVVTIGEWQPAVCPAPPAKPEQWAIETTTIIVNEQATGTGKACPATSTRQVFRDCTPMPPPPPPVTTFTGRIETVHPFQNPATGAVDFVHVFLRIPPQVTLPAVGTALTVNVSEDGVTWTPKTGTLVSVGPAAFPGGNALAVVKVMGAVFPRWLFSVVP